MLAAFLKSIDGGLDVPALVVSVLFALVALGNVLMLRKALITGRILFEWTPRTGSTIRFQKEREKNPTAFWAIFSLYCLCIVMFVAGIVVLSFGLLKEAS